MIALWIALGICAWVSATFFPLYLSVVFWRRAAVAKSPGLIHLLFGPTVLAVGWVSAFLLTLTDGDQDRPPDERGLGILLLPAMLIIVGTLIFYYGSVAARALRRIDRSKAKGG
ncbi:hypothetical protein [Sphingomonas sp.]|uniref:hypothetical protein n=1 Tax=Sphingomonas sp. TaxID=28214 RepID=UPI0035C7A113